MSLYLISFGTEHFATHNWDGKGVLIEKPIECFPIYYSCIVGSFAHIYARISQTTFLLSESGVLLRKKDILMSSIRQKSV